MFISPSKLITVTDLKFMTGTPLQRKEMYVEYLDGKRRPQLLSNYRWSLQYIPLCTARNLWRKFIKSIFQINGRTLLLEKAFKRMDYTNELETNIA